MNDAYYAVCSTLGDMEYYLQRVERYRKVIAAEICNLLRKERYRRLLAVEEARQIHLKVQLARQRTRHGAIRVEKFGHVLGAQVPLGPSANDNSVV